MGKLTAGEIDEYFSIHLPYRTRILVAHYRMSRTCWNGDAGWLDSAFIAALVTGRVFLNALGLGKEGSKLGRWVAQNTDDLVVADLGGKEVKIAALSAHEKDLLFGFIVMADKAGAHFTNPKSHDPQHYDDGIIWLCRHLKSHLYEASGRPVSTDIAAVLATLPQ